MGVPSGNLLQFAIEHGDFPWLCKRSPEGTQNGWFIMENPIQMDDFNGVPL